MEYEEAIDYIHKTYKFGIKLGLGNIKKLLMNMGNPQDNLKFVHVAGTNGKGSVVTYVSNVLISAGYKVGIFTSPYIEEFEERILINKEKIKKSDLARITSYVKSNVEELLKQGYEHPTEFEIITAVAMKYFYEKFCDIVILEVGLGGRYDSTNIIKAPLVSIITSISYDHKEQLGDTIEKIAYEKAGIIKKGTKVIIYPQENEAKNVIKRVCLDKKVEFKFISFENLNIIEYNFCSQVFNYKNYRSVEIMLHGNYQIKNAIISIEAIEELNNMGFKIDEKIIKEGLKNAIWPGRFELVYKNPYILIDGGHNYQGINELTKEIKRYFPNGKKVFIIAITKHKEYEKMIELISGIASSVIIFNTENIKAVEPIKLFSITKRYCKDVFFSDKIEEAFNLARDLTTKNDLICLCGSLYIIGDYKKMLRKKLSI